MSDLTLEQRFGSNVAFDENNKVLSIDLNDLSSTIIAGQDVGLNTSDMTNANQNEYASRILWALLQLSQASQPENNIDETVSVYVSNQGKRSVTRNGVAQFGFQLAATAYRNDNVGIVLDPDSIGA